MIIKDIYIVFYKNYTMNFNSFMTYVMNNGYYVSSYK